ncbi:hypothetical protein [Bacillus sp. UMB0893]|uniref:hypothetical protein n=1 Tax=Bacillus sp. UMB0893 TaxID=2066053 RepID=UPI0015DE81B7|nr:hypothetical protein [Bacillus sp. UMB0893]
MIEKEFEIVFKKLEETLSQYNYQEEFAYNFEESKNINELREFSSQIQNPQPSTYSFT